MSVLRASACLGLAVAVSCSLGPAAESAGPESIKNPYYSTTQWKVWRLDETPVEGVDVVVATDGNEQPATITLSR